MSEASFVHSGPLHARILARGAKGGFEEGSECGDTAGCYPNTDFDSCPDSEVGCAMEKIAFVGFEGGSVRKTNQGCGRAAGRKVSILRGVRGESLHRGQANDSTNDYFHALLYLQIFDYKDR